MSKVFPVAISMMALFSFACGSSGSGSSGVSGSKRVDQLSEAEAQDLCNWFVDQVPSSVTCNGETLEFGASEIAEQRENCTDATAPVGGECNITVSQAETCIRAFISNIESCTFEVPESCNALFACGDDDNE